MRTTRKITCEEASRLISSGMDRDLPAPARANLHLHFAVCAACKRFEQQMLVLRSALRGMRVGDERTDTVPPPDTPPREGADRR
jgi:hypothetical protein